MNQIKRYPNVVKLLTYESLFTNSQNKTDFLETHQTGVRKLKVFEEIHAQVSDEEDDFDFKLDTSECCKVEGEDTVSSGSTIESAMESFLDSEIHQFYLSD